MLFRKEFLEGISTGVITLAFRRWRRPSVRTGGTLLTPVGQLGIESVEQVSLDTISLADSLRAGYRSREESLDELQRRRDGQVYRIELGSLRTDPRIALRETLAATDLELQDIRSQLNRLDAPSLEGAWTFRTLETIDSHPEVRAGALCGLVGQDKKRFKLNVRQLKNLGLTESPGIGYRLSPRGEALLEFLRSEAIRNIT